MQYSFIIKTTSSVHITTVHANLIEQTTSSIELVVLKRHGRILVVIRKDSRCLLLHRLEQHRCILLLKETYRTLAQPADPCGNHLGDIISKIHKTHFKVGLGISRTNAGSQWNPVYNAFHRFFVVQTKRFVSSSLNVILTRQTCGQRSSKAAESIRRALGNYLSERICYMFLILKCRGDQDLDLCTFWVLAKREALRQPNSDFSCGRNTFFFGSSHCAAVLFSQVPKTSTNLELGASDTFWH